jgi:hypothetical protein
MLSLSSEENELGHNTEHIRALGIQICTFKLEAACQAEERSQKEAQEKRNPQRLIPKKMLMLMGK